MTGRPPAAIARLAALAAARPEIGVIVLLHAALSVMVWLSGSPAGSYSLECQVGAVGHDLAHGLNPAVPLLDYFDTFTGVYLTEGLIAAPLTLLPIDTIVAVKAGCLLSNALILVLAWWFLMRTSGRLAAGVGTLLLALGPPALRHQSLAGPQYHYNELLFDLGAMVLWVEIAVHERRSWPWYALLGLVCGWGITNCYGSAAFVAVVLVLLLVDWRRLLRPAPWVLPPALVLGVLPLLLKATVHRSYHQDMAGLRDFAVAHAGGGPARTLGYLAHKLGAFVSGDYGGALGFLDALGPAWGDAAALRVGGAYAAVTLLAVPLVLALGWWTLPPGAAAPMPGRRPAVVAGRAVALARMLPALAALALVLAYLTSNHYLKPAGLAESTLREDRYLPPLTAMLACNLGIAARVIAGLLGRVGALRGTLGRAFAALAGLLLAALAWPCVRAQVALVDAAGLRDTQGIPYRGRCYAAEAAYAQAALRGDPERGRLFCSGFPSSHHGECYRGFAWATAVDAMQRNKHREDGSGDPLVEAGKACEATGEPWARHCLQRVGWFVLSESIPFQRDWEGRVATTRDACRTLGSQEMSSKCLEGVGWAFADYFAFTPGKLPSVIGGWASGEVAPLPVARGIGSFYAHQYEDERTVERLCSAYVDVLPGFPDACREAARATWASDRLPLPGGPVTPGPLPPLR